MLDFNISIFLEYVEGFKYSDVISLSSIETSYFSKSIGSHYEDNKRTLTN